MTIRNRTIRKLTVLVVTVSLIAACGDTAVTEDPTTTEPPTTAPATSGATTAPSTTAPTTTSTAASQPVLVYFSVDGDDCAAVEAFERTGPASADPVRLALEQLLGGPTTEEEAAGAGSFFSAETADAVRSLDLTDGLLTVEFSDIRFLNNASTSCGSAALLSSLEDTLFQFAEIERVRFTIWGSCSLFWNWLQTECSEVSRLGTTPTPVDVTALASESGCTPGPGDLPDGTWFGYVTDPAQATVEFDLACWFSGAGAIEATLEDGAESPPPNDYYIRNVASDTRTVPVSPEVVVRWLPPEDIVNLTDIAYADWISIRPERDWLPGVWLQIEGGEVVSIEEQYQP
ncbi:MAG TPA: GerMN domain-containing protein [Acidimicrobiia bacterium]|jgi:hypothetical protein